MLSINRLCAGVEKTAESGQVLSQLWAWGQKTLRRMPEASATLQMEPLEGEVFPRIHGLVFNPKDGLLKKLPVDFTKRVGSLDHIYGLYKR